MTAIVAGQGLGLINTSLGLLGGQGQLGVASQGRSGEKVVLNAATGNLVIQQQDEWLVGVGPDVGIVRTYNSLAASDDDNGDNWRLGLNRKIVASGTFNSTNHTVVRTDEDGHESTYIYDAAKGAYYNADGGGSIDTLRWDGTTSTWTWTDGTSLISEAYKVVGSVTSEYRLQTVTDLDGKSLALTYNTTDRLITKITDGSGEVIDIEYGTGSANKNIKSITSSYTSDGATAIRSKRVSYDYDTSNRLITVTVDLTPANSNDTASYVTSYTYDDAVTPGTKRIKTLTQTGGSKLEFDYDAANGFKIKTIKEYTSATESRTTTLMYSAGSTTIQDALGQQTVLTYDTTTYSATNAKAGQLLSVTTPAVGGTSAVTTYTYDNQGNVTSVKDARGNTVVYRYDDNGNRIYERDAQGNVIERSYSNSNRLLAETVYTGLYADGPTPTLAQGGLTTRYVYDATGHLRFVISPEGRVTENKYNNLGQLTSTLKYSGGTFDGSTLPASWEQNFNTDTTGITLASGMTRVTPTQGEGKLQISMAQTSGNDSYPKASTADRPLGTLWKAELTVPSSFTNKNINLLHIGLESGVNSSASFRNLLLLVSDGNLYFKTQVGTGTPVKTLLGVGKPGVTYVLEIETQPDGSSAAYVYESGKERSSGYAMHLRLDTGSTTAKMVFIGYATASTSVDLNSILVDNISAKVQPRESDLASWLDLTAPGTSVTNKTLAQRVDYTYDFRGQLDKQITFAKTDSTTGAGLLDGTQSTSQYIYDQAGNLLQRIDGRGDELATQDTPWAQAERTRLGKRAVIGTTPLSVPDQNALRSLYKTSYLYDGLNRMQVQTDALGNATTTVYDDANLKATVTTAAGLTSVSTYDASGRLLSVNNTDNVVGALGTTSYTYDKLGRLVMVKTPGSQGNSAGNKTFYIYDAQGRKVGEVGPEGALTEYRYNKNNQVVRTIAYGKLLDATKLASLETNMVSTPLSIDTLIPAADIQNPDRSNWNVYDKAGRLVATLNACDSYSGDTAEAMSQTIYTYDGAGRLMSKRAYQIQATDTNVLAAVSAYTGELTLTGNSLYYGTSKIAVAASGGDAITRYYYSADGLRIGELNAENYYTAYSYDAAGRLISTQRYANAVTSVPAGNTPPTVTSSSGVSFDGEDQKTKYFYDAKGQLVTMVDAARYLTTYEYDTAGNRVKEVRFLAPVSRTFAGSPIPAIDSAKDHVTTYTYDANNRLTKTASQPSGLTTTNTYDSVGNLVNSRTVIKAQNQPDQVRQQQRRYDSLGRVTAEMGTLGAQALAALPSTATQADKDNVWKTYATQYVYDQSGQRVAMIEPNGTSASGYQTVYYYDKAGHLTYSINALGEIKQYKYNTFGQRTEDRSVKARLDDVSTLLGGSDAPTDLAFKSKPSNTADTIFATNYTRAGQVVSTYQRTSTAAFVDAHAYIYDGQGNLIEESRSNNAGSSWNSYEYNRLGQRTATTRYGDGPVDANNQPTIISTATSQTVYDAFGRVHYTVDERGMRTERFYDTRGRVTTAFEPYYFDASNTNLNPKVANGTLYRAYTYDAFDRVLQSTEPDGTYTTYQYDDVNRQVTITTMEGSVTVQTLDSAGQLVSVKDPKGYITKYAYDADGRLQSTKLYETDGSTLITDSSTVYDNMGRVLSTKDGRGTVTSLKYDKANRVITRTVDDGGLSLKTSYHYDTQSLWTQDANGVWTKTVYDRKGRVSSITVDPKQIPQAGTADDVTGDKLERALVANPTGGLAITTTYTYDNANQVVTQTQGAGSASAVTTTYVYDSLGRRKSETVGPTTAAKPITTSYQYDDQDRVIKKTDAEQHVTYYFYDAAGRQRFVVDGNGALTKYTYDLNGRLSQTCRYGVTVSGVEGKTAAQMEALATTNASPSIDQVTTNVYSQDGRLQYVRDAAGGLTKYQYDKSGNVIQVTRFATLCATPTVAAGDGQQKAFAITEPASVPTQDQVTRNIYDGANRRTWTLTSDYTTQAKVYATRYLYDANGNVIESRKYANLVQTRSPAAALASGEVAITGTGAALNDLYILADDSADQRTRTLYDKANRATFVIDGEDYVTRNDYDNLGHLKSSTRFAGKLGGTFTAGQAPDIFPAGTTSYGPSSSWIVQASNTALDQDRIVSYDYDNAGRQTTEKTTDRTGTTLRATKKVYDAAGHVTDEIDAYGTGQDVTTHYNYDTAGRLIEEIKGQGTSAQATTRYGLDNLGQRTSIIDPRGVELAESDSDWAKSTRQDLVTAGKLDSSYLNSYTTFSDTQKATLKALYTTEQRFDAQGHVTYVKDALGGTTCTDYDAFGNAIRIKDPNGNYGYFVFNQNNQSIWAIDPLGYATKTDYDALGQVTTITKYGNAVQNKDAVWSDANKITKAPTFYPDQAAYTAANGSTAPTFAYLIGSPDVLSGQTLVSAGKDAITKIEHDLLGRQTKITDAENNPESMKYDALGNKTSYTNKLNGEYKYTYDRVGNLKQETLPETVKQYDANGGVTSNGNLVINQYSYDARGNRTKAIEALGLQEERTTTYTYDALDRQVSKASQAMDVYTTDRSALVSNTPSTLTITEGTVTKLNGAESKWDNASFSSSQGYVGGASISFSPVASSTNATNGYFFIGLSTKPNATSYGDLDWCFHGGFGGVDVYQKGGVGVSGVPSTLYSASDTLTVAYDGARIRFLKNGTQEIYSQAFQTNQPLYASGFLLTPNFSVANVAFGAITTVNGVSTNKVTPTENKRYDARGNLIEARAADGGRTLYYYDALNRKTAEVSPTGTLIKYTYDDASHLIAMCIYGDAIALPATAGGTIPDPIDTNNFRITKFKVDARGRQTNTIIEGVTTGQLNPSTNNYEVVTGDLITTRDTDANGNVVYEEDARKNGTYSYFDKAGNKILQVDAERYVTQWAYDGNGKVKSMTRYAKALDPLVAVSKDVTAQSLIDKLVLAPDEDRTTEYTYDRLGQLLEERTLKVLVSALDGNHLPVETSKAVSTKYEYNGLGQVLKKTDAKGDQIDFAYDKQGRQTLQQDPKFTDFEGKADARHRIVNEYNGLSLVRRTLELGKDDGQEGDDHITVNTYGKNGILIAQTDAQGVTQSFKVDQAGRITSKKLVRTDANGIQSTDTTDYVYDLVGRQTQQIVKNTPTNSTTATLLQTTETGYNAYGDIVSKGVNGGKQEFAQYDKAGRLFKSNSGSGSVKVYVNDATGNATLTIESSGTNLRDLTLDQILGLSSGARALDSFAKSQLQNTTTYLTFNQYDKLGRATDTYTPSIDLASITSKISAQSLDQSVFNGNQSSITLLPAQTISASQSGYIDPTTGSATATQTFEKITINRTGGIIHYQSPWVSTQTITLNKLPDYSYYGAQGSIRVQIIWMPNSSSARREENYTFDGQPITSSFTWGAPPNYINQEIFVYKKTATNQEVLVAHILPESSQSTKFGDIVYVTATGCNLAITDQTSRANRVIAFARDYAHTDAQCLIGRQVVDTLGAIVPGMFMISLPSNSTGQITYFTLDSNNQILNTNYVTYNSTAGSETATQSGTSIKDLNWTTDTPNGSGWYLPSESSRMNLILPPAATKLKLRYKYQKNGGAASDWISVDSSISNNAIDLRAGCYNLGGNPTPGWFNFAYSSLPFTVGDTYDYTFDVVATNDAGAEVNRFQMNYTRSGDGVVVPSGFVKPYSLQSSIVKLTELAITKYIDLSYKKFGTQDVPQVVRLYPSSNGSGQFSWDASALTPDPLADYKFEVSIKAYIDGDLLNNWTNATLQLGPNANVVSASAQTLPQILRLTASEATADNIQISYRKMGSTGVFLPLSAVKVNGEFRVDLSSIALPTSGSEEYEYIYDAYQGSKLLNRANGSFFVQAAGATGNGIANRLDWVITSNTVSNTIHKSQTYNAFGEVKSETDGRGNTTSFAYTTLGKLLTKTDPSTKYRGEDGEEHTQATPTTRYYYDEMGRQIGIKDARNTNNTQALLAAFSDGRLRVAAEYHADQGIKSSGYDVFGNLRYNKDEIARRTDYTYDKNNRLTKLERPMRSANVRAYDSYTYDEAGNRITHTTTDGVGTTPALFTDKVFVDAAGRITKTTTAEGRDTQYTYTYDANITGLAAQVVGGWRKVTTDAVGRTTTDESDIFGHNTKHIDLGGHTFNYAYNRAGWLTSQTSLGVGGSGQNISYDYYANGFIKAIWDKGVGTYTSYEYDANGNKTFEGYVTLRNPLDLQGGVLDYYQYAVVTYDELNRVKSITDPKATITYDYDEVGNRRHVKSVYHNGVNGAQSVQDYWYTYDTMNRFLVTMGSLANGVITRGAKGGDGVTITYNAAGERSTAIYAVDEHKEVYGYTTEGYLETISVDTDLTDSIDAKLGSKRVVDLMGRTTTYNQYDATGATVTFTRQTTYDKDSRVAQQTGTDGTVDYYYFTDNTDNASTATKQGKGGLSRVTTVTPQQTTLNSYYHYAYWDEAKQTDTTNVATNPKVQGDWKPGYAHEEYDVNGHLARAVDAGKDGVMGTSDDRVLRYATNAQGLILRRDEVDAGVVQKLHNYYYLDGHRVGEVGNDGDARVDFVQSLAKANLGRDDYKNWRPIASADFDQNFEPLGANYPTNSPSTYTVHSGDTLQRIAQTLWGDSSLWYLIADANGLTGSEALPEGLALTIPNKVTNIHNNSSTYRVYNPGEAIGDVSPTLPDAPPPPQPKKCGLMGQVISAVIMVVATIYGGVLGAMVANAVIQYASVSMGYQERMVWKNVAITGATAAVTAGMDGGAATSATAAAVHAAATNIVTQGVLVALHLQEKFDWAAVATACVGGAISYGVSGMFNSMGVQAGSFGNDLMRGMTTNVLVGAARAAIYNEDPDWSSIASSSFSNAFSSAVDAEIKRGNGPVSRWINSTAEKAPKFDSNIFGEHLGNKVVEAIVQSDAWKAVEEVGSALGDAVVGSIQRADSQKTPAISENGDGAVARSELRYGKPDTTKFDLPNVDPSMPFGPSDDPAVTQRLAELDSRLNPTSELDDPLLVAADKGYTLGRKSTVPQMREMTAGESFLTFNPLGKALRGYSDSALSILRSPLTALEGTGNLLSDAYGYSKDALFGPEVGVFGDERPYEAKSSLVKSLKDEGLAGTIGGLTVSSVKSLPGIATIGGLYRGDAYEIGGSLPNLFLSLDAAAINQSSANSLPALRERYGVNEANLKVEATFDLGGKTFYDVNQTARNEQMISDRKLPIYSEAKATLGAPNQTFADAHAEVGAMGQAYLSGRRGGEATLTIYGKDACSYCLTDVKKMAMQLQLDKLTVVQPSGTVIFNGAKDFAPVKLGGKKW